MRTNIRRTTAATAVLTALSLTACQSDDKDQSAPKPSSSASTTAPATDTPSSAASTTPAAEAPQGGGKTKTPAADSGTDGTDGTDGTNADPGVVTAACTGSTTKVSVTHVSRPIQHLLLTVTNTGSKACNAYHAPLLRVDDAQAVMSVYEESQPQAVVTLVPGESGYAAIALGAGGRTAKQLEVHFAASSGEGSTGTPKKLALPAGTDIDDAGASVTYWQRTLADALTN
ncbi:DUF4232 domain-containing protein [Streptomyces sp. NPDC020681]|uniref:DUF4232 domain-containing protein n=1 Tax=Streptomyces sp. NPDC020681 TaxID=3365083 RepID=UPI0037A9DA28